MAATRRGVAEVNRLALQALHAGAAPVAHLPGTYEDNPDNYVAGRLRADRCPSPAEVPIHTGSRLYLTRNVRKADDFLNGMGCTVLSHSTEGQILWVRTDTGKRFPSHRGTTQSLPGWSTIPSVWDTAALLLRCRAMNFLSSSHTWTPRICQPWAALP